MESQTHLKLPMILTCFFCNIGNELAAKIPPGNENLVPEILGPGTLFVFDHVHEDEVLKLLKNLNTAKSTGLDGISPRYLKCAATQIVLPITHIINEAIRTSMVPRDWKTARVSPLYKDGKKDEISNYRPISVLPVMAKLFERILHDQLYQYFDVNGLLDPNQSGFRSGHSTTSCTVGVLNHIYDALDKGGLTGAVFLDLRKAFDTVSHPILP